MASIKALAFRFPEGLLALLSIVVVSGVAASVAYFHTAGREFKALADSALQHLEIYAAGLESELARHESLPSIMELDEDVQALFAATTDTKLRERVNKRLVNLNVRAGSLSISVLDPGGTVIASSDWFAPQSMLGRSLSSTSYFTDAMQSGQARSFSVGPDGSAPECHFVHAVRQQGRIVGVIAVRISLEPVESLWMALGADSQSDNVLVVDENDVVILASSRAWKFKSVKPMPTDRQAMLSAMGRYPVQRIEALGMALRKQLPHGAQLVVLQGSQSERPGDIYVAQERVLARFGWRITTLSAASQVAVGASRVAFAVTLVVALCVVLMLYLVQRKRDSSHRLAAREALQRAHDELEERVRQRTEELRNANDLLKAEVAERTRTEQELRRAQTDLIQAGKLAVLGQMSAGITHEITQPLTALRALSDNTRRLLDSGRLDAIDKNLVSISSLTERIGRLASQLKTFASKPPATRSFCLLGGAISNSLEILHSRLSDEGVTVSVNVPPRCRVVCDAYRLEQVLLNLLGNALDAVKASPKKALGITTREEAGRIHITVSDSGPGIDPEIQQRLFEPFFTTKPPGKGLGLGLVISSSIVRECGGTLRLVEAETGTAFEFDLATEGGTHAD